MKKEEQAIAELWEVFNKRMVLDSFQMKRDLNGYHPSEIHCIDAIGKNAESNVTKLAESFSMTRSAVSKLTKKLIKKGLIVEYQKPENRKEIYFKLTEEGKRIFEIHGRIHDEIAARDKSLFAEIPEDEFDTVIHFAKRYNQHLDLEIQRLGIDRNTEGNDTL